MKNVRHQQNTGRSGAKRTSELPRDKPKTSKNAPRTLPKAFSDTNGLHERSGTSQDRLGAVLGAFPGGLGASQGALGAPRGVLRAVLGHPGRFLDRSGGVLAASRGLPVSPRGGPVAPRSILERFLFNFPSPPVRFSSIFAFRVGLVRCFRRAGASRRVACAIAAASDKPSTSWGLRRPPCSVASPVPGVRAFPRAMLLA